MSGFLDGAFYNPKQDRGFWSPTTAKANFCEEDYAISFYVGESINTLTNLAYIYFAIYPPKLSFKISTKSGRDTKQHALSQAPTGKIWDAHAIALIAIGLSSASFHLTLQKLPQFLDDSSMYILVAGFCYAMITTDYVQGNGTTFIARKHRLVTAVIIVAVLLATTTWTLRTGELLIHSLTFGAGIVVSGLKLITLIRHYDPSSRPKLRWSLSRCAFFFLAGFVAWLIDCDPSACAFLRGLRKQLLTSLPVPLGQLLAFLTELHGWWHVLTAYAAGEYTSLVRFLTLEGPAHLHLEYATVSRKTD